MEKLLSRIPRQIYQILDTQINNTYIKRLPSSLSILDATLLLSSTDSASIAAIASTADLIRSVAPCGDRVSYVINRNINFTNACIKRCGFCAFSRTGIDEEAYFLPLTEILRRVDEG